MIPQPSVLPHPQLFDLEKRRQQRVAELATLIQKMFRGWCCRKRYQLMRKSQILISAWFRGHMVRGGGGGVPAVLRSSPFTPWGWGHGGSLGVTPPSLLPPAAKEQVQADEALSAAAAGVRTGLEGEHCAPRGHLGSHSGAVMLWSWGVGGVLLPPGPSHPISLRLSSCLSPFLSVSLAMRVGVSLSSFGLFGFWLSLCSPAGSFGS